MSWLTKIVLLFAGLGLAVGILFWVRSGLSRMRPPQLGLDSAGRLRPCPSKPNCVSSQAPATDRQHFIPSFPYSGTRQETQAKLGAVLEATSRLAWVTRQDEYWHLTATSALFRFVDDVEFVFDDEAKKVHARSASRVGTSDLGVNRKRVEALRQDYEAGPAR